MKTRLLLLTFVLICMFNSVITKAQTFSDVYSSTSIPHGSIIEIFDYDNDGLEDWVYEIYGDSIFSLLKNNGNGNFTNVTSQSQFPSLNPTTFYNNTNDPNPTAVDIDNDGDADIFYWESLDGDLYLHLWENRNGVFQEVSTCIGWGDPLLTGNLYTDGMKSFQFIDYDKDGDLDITYNDYVTDSSNQCTVLLQNNINTNGTFNQKITLISGYPAHSTTRVYPFDFDNDSDFDFIGWEVAPLPFTTFNFHQIKLFRNDGGGNFSDITSSSGLTTSNYYGGVTFFDFNSDGFLDVLYGCTDNNFNALPDNKFFQNNGNGTFTDITATNNVHYSNHYNSPTAIDYNNDGGEDLSFDMNGYGMTHAPFYENQSGQFVENSQALGINFYFTGGPNYTGGRRWIDYNNDGLLDEFVGGGANNFLFKNNLPFANTNYLNITLKGCTSPTDASGTKAVIWMGGTQHSLYYISGRISSNRQSSRIMHFGLGSTNQVDSLIVYWPGGLITRQYNVAANQNLTIEEVQGCTRTPSYIAGSTNTINATMCQGDSLYVGGQFQTNPGTYLDYYPGSGSCDSLVITNLSFTPALPQPTLISGPDTVCSNEQNVVFSISPVNGATSYQWSIPVGSTLNSGAGTSSINITFGTGSGYVVVSAVNSCGVGPPASSYVITTSCAGLNEISSMRILNLSPNPSDQFLNVRLLISEPKDLVIKIKNATGKSIIQPIISKSQTGIIDYQIPVSKLSNGIYFIEISTEDGTVTGKIMVDHQ